ncbi:MAG: SMP-30/gluconolactonase/LRE family protein [Sphingobium sp.]
MTQISVACDARCELGEGPRWHGEEGRLYWVDIAAQAMHRLNPRSGQLESRTFDTPVGCFAFVAGGGWMLAMKDGFAYLADWQAEPTPFGEQVFAGQPDLRFNDGRTDASGRFWAGSVNTVKSAHNAALYRLDGDGAVTLIENGMMTCNGAAFSVDGAHFCHTDTPSHALRMYDVDVATRTLANRRILHQFPPGQGRPDGGSFDCDGFYWTALFDGGRVVCLSPDGEIVREVPLPVTRPTMISFGGEDLCTAYVTSARSGLSPQQLAKEPLAGAMFSFRVDTPGISEHPFVMS